MEIKLGDNSFFVKKFLFWFLVQIYDKEGARIVHKWCLKYKILENSVILGGHVYFINGRLFRIVDHSLSMALFVVKDYKVDKDQASGYSVRTDYYRVLNYKGEELHREKSLEVNYGTFEEKVFCIRFFVVDDEHFCLLRPNGFSVMSTDFKEHVKVDDNYSEVVIGKKSGKRCFICKDHNGNEVVIYFKDLNM